jgi:lipoprotein-anchoring transpeptidase ErfK/SrfK
MNRIEGLSLLVLVLITALTLSFAPPSAAPEASLAPTATATLTVTSTPSPRPSVTPTASNTATRTGEPTAPWTATPAPSATPTPTPTATPFPFDTHPEEARFIYIDQATQHMYIFERGRLLRDIPCSTGLPDPDKYTPAWTGRVGHYVGTFFSFGVYADDAWYLYQSAGAILIHSLPYTLRNGYKVYQDRDALGVRPSSHGCIRIAPEDAAWLTQWNPQGALAVVTEPYLEKWRR